MGDDARTPRSLESRGAEISVERSLNHELTSATTFGSDGVEEEEEEVSREESCLDSADSQEQPDRRGAAAPLRFQV